MDSIFNGWTFISKLMAGIQCVFSPQKAGKGSLFLKLWLEFQLYLSGYPVYVLHAVLKTGEMSFFKCLLNMDIICKLALEKQEMPPLVLMIDDITCCCDGAHDLLRGLGGLQSKIAD